jgi:hypothetical protein
MGRLFLCGVETGNNNKTPRVGSLGEGFFYRECKLNQNCITSVSDTTVGIRLCYGLGEAERICNIPGLATRRDTKYPTQRQYRHSRCRNMQIRSGGDPGRQKQSLPQA